MLRTLLGGSGDATAAEPDSDPEPEPEPPTDEQLRDAFAEAIEDTDTATILGAVAGDLIDLAYEDRERFTDRLRAMRSFGESIDPDDPRDLDAIEAEADAIGAVIESLQARGDLLAAERETHDHDERLEPFDLPHNWTREASTFGDDYVEATVALRDHIRARGEASTDELYELYRRSVPGSIMGRKIFGVRVCPVLAGADGVEARLYRLDPDEALTGEAVDEAASEPVYRFGFGAEAVAAMYRELAEAPPCGLTRLGLASAARKRAHVALTEAFIGPEELEDIGRDGLHERAEGLAALLDLPGVEPPADPEWRWVGGEDDE